MCRPMHNVVLDLYVHGVYILCFMLYVHGVYMYASCCMYMVCTCMLHDGVYMYVSCCMYMVCTCVLHSVCTCSVHVCFVLYVHGVYVYVSCCMYRVCTCMLHGMCTWCVHLSCGQGEGGGLVWCRYLGRHNYHCSPIRLRGFLLITFQDQPPRLWTTHYQCLWFVPCL